LHFARLRRSFAAGIFTLLAGERAFAICIFTLAAGTRAFAAGIFTLLACARPFAFFSFTFAGRKRQRRTGIRTPTPTSRTDESEPPAE
jgi:hypothetical protein